MEFKRKPYHNAFWLFIALNTVNIQPSYALISKLSSILSSDKKVAMNAAQELKALLNVETLLVEIQKLNTKVKVAETKISNEDGADKDAVIKDLNTVNSMMRDIALQVTNDIKQKIDDIQKLIDQKKGNIINLRIGLNKETETLKLATQFDSATNGFLPSIKAYAQKNDAASKQKIQNDIKVLREKYRKLLDARIDQEQYLKDIKNSPSYVQKTQGLPGQIIILNQKLVEVAEKIEARRQNEVFSNNNNADKLINGIRTAISDAKCSFRDMSGATSSNIKACKQQKLTLIYKTRASSCQSLETTSNRDNVEQCINDLKR